MLERGGIVDWYYDRNHIHKQSNTLQQNITFVKGSKVNLNKFKSLDVYKNIWRYKQQEANTEDPTNRQAS